jgi:hypothetical protein
MPDNMKTKMSRKRLELTLFFVIIAGSILVGYILVSKIDPRSSVDGYRVFTGKTDGFLISFSYPDSWKRSTVSSTANETSVDLDFQNQTIVISSEISNNESVNAVAIIQKYIDRNVWRPEFIIFHQDTIILGNQEAQDLLIGYRFVFDDHELVRHIDKPFFERIVASDFQGRTYMIYAPINLEEYEITNQVIDNVIETFEFID